MINWIKKIFKSGSYKPEEKKPDVERWIDENGYPRTKYTVDVSSLTFSDKEDTVAKLVESYTKDFKWDDNMGELTISGTPSLPYNKQIWFGQD